MQIQPFTGLQNPQQPIGGLLTAGFNPYPQASVNAQGSPSSGLLAGMGPWSQLAYQMAGSPKQGGPYAQVAAPPTPVNTNVPGSSGGSAVGSIATGLLGSVLKNPSLLKSAYNGISGLLGSAPTSVLAGGAPGLAPVGVDAVSELPSVSAAVDAAPAASVPAGLLASSAPAASGANAIASGTAAASQTGGAAGSIGAGIAAPLAVAGLVGLIGSGVVSDKANDSGNDAMKAWSNAAGAKWVNSPGSATSGNNFGLSQNQLKGGIDTGYYLMPDGSKLNKTQALSAIQAWAKANNMPLGNLGG